MIFKKIYLVKDDEIATDRSLSVVIMRSACGNPCDLDYNRVDEPSYFEPVFDKQLHPR